MKKPLMFRQGDVLLVAIAALAVEAVPVKSERLVVLAHGEATGHAHVMDGKTVEEFRTPKPVAVPGVRDWHAERFLRVQVETALRHEKAGQLTGEHDTLQIPAGDYALVPQCEWSDEHEPRRVED
jgi:hypothetical protein